MVYHLVQFKGEIIPNLTSPGVYVTDIDIFSHKVEPPSSCVPVFFGYTEKAIDATGRSLYNRPFPIASLSEFEQVFGSEIATAICVDTKEVVKVSQAKPTFELSFTDDYQVPDFMLYLAVKHYFENGGESCIVMALGNAQQKIFKKQHFTQGLSVLKQEPAINLVVMPDLYSRRFESGQEGIADVIDFALNACSQQQNCFLLCDIPQKQQGVNPDAVMVNDFVSSIRSMPDVRSFGAIYFPFIHTTYQPRVDWDKVELGIHRVVKLDKKGQQTLSTGHFSGMSVADPDLGKKHPDLVAGIKQFVSQTLSVCLPASAAIAGVFCRVDSQRGVWKAPADQVLHTVVKPSVPIDDHFQSIINQHPDGATNPIREVKNRGIVVWGARTLAANHSQWEYIVVRRTMSWIRESIYLSLMTFVFEANAPETWRNMENMVQEFLHVLWREGALRGAKQEQAFYVSIGLGETMTQNDVRDNKIIMRIGVALLRPAEFLSFSLEIPSSQ